MRELITRALSGAVYVGTVVALLLLDKPYSLVLYGIFGIIGFFEFRSMFRKSSKIYWTSLLSLMGICGLVWSDEWSFLFLGIIIASAFLAMGIEHIFTKGSEHSIQGMGTSAVVLLYLAMPLALAGTEKLSSSILTIFILIWANDSFAYVVGRLIGRTPLVKRLSPNKTIEGMLGGLLLTGVASYFLFQYTETTVTTWNHMMGLAAVVSIFGTLGDLFESSLKRSAGVKDSGNILPGHGGILDRIDSFLFVVPACAVYFFLFQIG